MRSTMNINVFLILVALGCWGCTPSKPPSPDTPESDTSDKDTGKQATDSDDSSTADDTGAEPAGAVSVEVRLGDDELTAGIPGEGELTLEQIKAWLDDEKNHLVLSPKLPLGLSLGQDGMIGLAENPLTRAKIELGRQLYFDRRLSADSTVSCADCHHPEEGYARHTQFGVGIGGQTGGRNSPVSYNRILSGAQFWDGRAASLEEQAVGPIANPIEMGNTHEAAVETLKRNEGYAAQFDRIFDDGVTIDNVGRAIASFERVIVTGSSPFDYYEPLRALQTSFKDDLEDLEALKEDDPDLYEQYQSTLKASEAHPISESAKRGRDIFFGKKGGCTACHVGPNLADEKYHNLGVGMKQEKPDLGRFEVTKKEKDRGAFKTPTIRNVALSAPYMHDGSQKTLEDVVAWYNQGGHPNPQLSDAVRKLELTEQEQKDLVEFMKACTGEFPKVETERLPK